MTVDVTTGEIIEGGALVPAENVAALDTLDPADQEVAVTRMLSEARSWLAHAIDATEPTRIADFKAFIGSVADASRRLGLSKDIQLDAEEMVRRAERGLGLAIRRGQEAGEIGRRGDQRSDQVRDKDLVSPKSLVAHNDELTAVYAVTDDVTDSEFESVITEAKAEGNLSRANVVRKVKGESPKPTNRPEILRGTRHHDANRIVEETVLGLEGYCLGLDLIDFDRIDRARTEAWVASLRQSIRRFNRLVRELDA